MGGELFECVVAVGACHVTGSFKLSTVLWWPGFNFSFKESSSQSPTLPGCTIRLYMLARCLVCDWIPALNWEQDSTRTCQRPVDDSWALNIRIMRITKYCNVIHLSYLVRACVASKEGCKQDNRGNGFDKREMLQVWVSIFSSRSAKLHPLVPFVWQSASTH